MMQTGTSEEGWSYMFNTSNCASLNDSYPSFVVQVSCTNGYPETSGNLGYCLLKQGAIATLSASRVSWYAIATWQPTFLPVLRREQRLRLPSF